MGQISLAAWTRQEGTKDATSRKANALNRAAFALVRALCAFAVVLNFFRCELIRADVPVSTSGTHPTVASLVPAATDLLVQMRLSDHLVGISNYDDAAALHLKGLPRVGDYQTIDWERLNQIRPDILIIFESPDRVSAGLRQRADAIHTQLVNVRTETITDIVAEAHRLGKLVREEKEAGEAIHGFENRLEMIRRRTVNLSKTRTLLVLDPGSLGVVGTQNFLDDALRIAGGENVIKARGWPNIDIEMLRALKPQMIVALLSEQTPQAIDVARRFLDAQASPDCRTAIISRWYAQQSSFSVADVAEQLADVLHPPPATAPATEQP